LFIFQLPAMIGIRMVTVPFFGSTFKVQSSRLKATGDGQP
jgi:hypothetical protein